VILALTLMAFGSILYVTQYRATFNSIKSDLVRQAGFVNEGGGSPSPLDGPPGPVPSALPVETGFSTSLRGRWTQTLSIDGAITAQTPDLSGTSLPLSAEGLQAVQDGASWFERAEVDGEPLLIYSRSYTTLAGERAIVQVAFPISQSLHSLRTLRLILIVGSSLVFLAAFVVGWILAGEALRPIHRITRTAQAIGAERNFSRRVEHRGPADEVGQLAVTFNEMLAELESGYRQLETALGSQRRFVADASHELRTPLTTVRGNVELLGREPPIEPEDRAEILQDTIAEVERLIRLVNQLLMLARADAGLELRRGPVPLRPLLEDICRQSRLVSGRGQMVCDPPAEEIVVLGDHDALKQVLLILVDNAHQHTAPGTVIRLSARAKGGSASVSVHDSGEGIAPEILPHIFERFYRGDSSRTGAGAGLGLAIARELVERQSGTISVESEPSKGSIFSVTLPRCSGDSP
jgi:two-component system, OmpR family, sensor kinase